MPQPQRTFGAPSAFMACVAIASMLLFTACGNMMEEEGASSGERFGSATPQEIEPGAYPVPDPGQRFFPAPVRDFFPDNDNIITMPPDTTERKPLVLKDDVYWLPDEQARTNIEYSHTKLVYPLNEKTESMLGYRPGHLLLNKYFKLHHRIEKVSVHQGKIILDTSFPKIGEAVAMGRIYLHIKPGTQVPIGFDATDPYIYTDREEQVRDIYENYLDSPLIQEQYRDIFIDKVDLEQTEEILDQIAQQARARRGQQVTRQQAATIEHEVNECNVNPKNVPKGFHNGLPYSLDVPSCSHDNCSTWDGDGEGSESPGSQCIQDVYDNIDQYRAKSSGSHSDRHRSCVDAGTSGTTCVDEINFDEDGNPVTVTNCYDHCLCHESDSEEQCVKRVCEDLCGYEDPSETTSHGGVGGSLSLCINPDTHPEANDEDSPHWHKARCPGDIAIRGKIGLKCLINRDLVAGCEVFSEGFIDTLLTDPGAAFEQIGDAASSLANPFDDGDDMSMDGGDMGMEDDDGGSGPIDIVSFLVRPILNLTVGFKADLDIDIWKPKVQVKLGFYAGIGYGVNAELRVGPQKDGLKPFVDSWTLREILDKEQVAFFIPIFFGIGIGIDPVLQVKGYAQASIGGKFGYEYYDEKWFYMCLRFPSSKVFTTGEDGRRNCGLPNHVRDAKFNGFYRDDSNHLEIHAGLSAALGVEFTLAAAKIPIGGDGNYVRFYPLEARASLIMSLLAPRCYGSIRLGFGGLAELELTLIKILGKKIGWYGAFSWTYDGSRFLGLRLPDWRFFKEFPIRGEPWKTAFGCGEFPEPEPTEYESVDCPTQPNPDDLDGNCAAELGTDARCFIEECVEQRNLRVSLGWQSLHDLNLYVRDPNGRIYSAGTAGSNFTRTSCGSTCGEENSNRFIENLGINSTVPGEYVVWASLNSDSNGAFTIPFTIEVEENGSDGIVKVIKGEFREGEDRSAASFKFCLGGDDTCQQ